MSLSCTVSIPSDNLLTNEIDRQFNRRPRSNTYTKTNVIHHIKRTSLKNPTKYTMLMSDWQIFRFIVARRCKLVVLVSTFVKLRDQYLW